MAIRWRNSFDGPHGQTVTPANSALYGDALAAVTGVVRYSTTRRVAGSALGFGSDDGAQNGVAHIHPLTGMGDYSFRLYWYLPAGGWMTVRDENSRLYIYLDDDPDFRQYFVGAHVITSHAPNLIGQWVRIEARVVAGQAEYQFWWGDIDAPTNPDLTLTNPVPSSALADLRIGGGGADQPVSNIDEMAIAEGEWIGPGFEHHDGTAAPTVSAEVVTAGGKHTGTQAETTTESQVVARGGRTVHGTTHTPATPTVTTQGGKSPTATTHSTAETGVRAVGQANPTMRARTEPHVTADGFKTIPATTTVEAAPGVGTASSSGKTGTSNATAHTDVTAVGGKTRTGTTRITGTHRIATQSDAIIPGYFEWPFQIHTELWLPGAPDAKPDGWVDITGDVRDTEDIAIERGRGDWASHADASRMSLKLNNRHGRYSPRNPYSPYHGLLKRSTPARVYVLDQAGEPLYRWAGEVAEWPMEWHPLGVDSWVNLEGSGALRRLNQGSSPAHDALRRFITRHRPLGYWPVDNGSAVRSIPSGIPGGNVMGVLSSTGRPGLLRERASQLEWGSGQLAAWLTPVAQVPEGHGVVTATLPLVDNAAPAWAVEMVRAGQSGASQFDWFSTQTVTNNAGAGIQFTVRFNSTTSSGGPDVRLYARTITTDDNDAGGGFTLLETINQPRVFMDVPRLIRLECRLSSNGNGVTYSLWIDGRPEPMGSGNPTGTTSAFGPLLPVDNISYRWTAEGEGDDQTGRATIGHFTVWNLNAEPPPPDHPWVWLAMQGHAGEKAGHRIARLCEEEGIGLQVIGSTADTVAMGPQYPEQPIEAMRECEEADDGVLFEARDRPALLYRTGRSKYQRTRSRVNGNGTSNGNGGLSG